MDTERVARELRTYLVELQREQEAVSRKIASTETMLADLGEPVRRGPGRPKGSGVKRGPGRPRKNPLPGEVEASGATPVRRGPGRPKGSGVKRGPGRPKGSGASASADGETKARGRKPMSPAAREAARQRMKQYWAERRKAASTSA